MRPFLRYLLSGVTVWVIVDYTTAFNPDTARWFQHMPDIWLFYIGYPLIFAYLIYTRKWDNKRLIGSMIILAFIIEVILSNNIPAQVVYRKHHHKKSEQSCFTGYCMVNSLNPELCYQHQYIHHAIIVKIGDYDSGFFLDSVGQKTLFLRYPSCQSPGQSTIRTRLLNLSANFTTIALWL
jgi:hypothetical protein